MKFKLDRGEFLVLTSDHVPVKFYPVNRIEGGPEYYSAHLRKTTVRTVVSSKKMTSESDKIPVRMSHSLRYSTVTAWGVEGSPPYSCGQKFFLDISTAPAGSIITAKSTESQLCVDIPEDTGEKKEKDLVKERFHSIGYEKD